MQLWGYNLRSLPHVNSHATNGIVAAPYPAEESCQGTFSIDHSITAISYNLRKLKMLLDRCGQVRKNHLLLEQPLQFMPSTEAVFVLLVLFTSVASRFEPGGCDRVGLGKTSFTSRRWWCAHKIFYQGFNHICGAFANLAGPRKGSAKKELGTSVGIHSDKHTHRLLDIRGATPAGIDSRRT